MSPRIPAPASSTRRRATAATTSRFGRRRVESSRNWGIDTRIPYTVDADGFFTKDAPGFTGRRVIDDKGHKGDANDAVMKALIEAGNLVARGKLKHQYPHSWRSKKPLIFRNTPQWFIALDKAFEVPLTLRSGRSPRLEGRWGSVGTPSSFETAAAQPPQDEGAKSTLREIALREIAVTQWHPPAGENRITGMIANRPDWVVSRQRAWGVPIAIFVHQDSGEILKDPVVNARIAAAFENEGADAWFAEGAAARFLGGAYTPEHYEKIDDVLDVWFDSGSTHAFTLDDPKHFPGLAGIHRKRDGGGDEIMYLEGSDQHRGWFHSSLLESCGTRGRAPFDLVLTHGFVLDEKGQKMSKSLGNVTAPQTIIKEAGADILRLWVAASDYSDDLRIGPEILKTFVETYRKLRNTIRWMLGSLAHYEENRVVAPENMGELERLMLHRLAELDRRGPDRLSRLRPEAGRRASFAIPQQRSVGVLFRHPQGCALLRAAFEPKAPRGALGDRADFSLRHAVARADPRLHLGRSLARALPREKLSPSRNSARSPGGLAR